MNQYLLDKLYQFCILIYIYISRRLQFYMQPQRSLVWHPLWVMTTPRRAMVFLTFGEDSPSFGSR